MRSYRVIAVLVALMAGIALPARADAPSELQAMKVMLEGMKEQMAKMQETIERQSVRIAELESARLAEAAKPAVMLEPAKAKDTPSWLEGLASKGDLRLRYEAFEREDEDASDRNRFRFRLRWGLEKKFENAWKAGFRLASSEDRRTPTSTNQTLDEEFSFKQVFFDRAYAKFMPTEAWKNVIPAIHNVEIGGGKVENPYDRDKWNTTIIWDSDVTPEGLYEQVDFRLATPGEDAYWDFNTLFGQWIVDEDSDLKPGDHEMYSYGAGTTYQWKKNHKLSFKATYYDWEDYAQFIKSSSGIPDNLGGNDREVEDFKILNFYADVNFEVPTFWGAQHVAIFGDYAHNTGLQSGGSTDETLRDPALRGDSDDAFSAGATLGKIKDPGSWSFMYEYYYIEPNAVVGNFSEADIGLGFTNNKGHKLAWKYMILKDMELNLTAWLVERVDKTILTYGASGLRPRGDDDEVLRTQVDLNWKF